MSRNPIYLYYMAFVILHGKYDESLPMLVEGFFCFCLLFSYVLIMLILCWILSIHIMDNKLHAYIGLGLCVTALVITYYLLIWKDDVQKSLRKECSQLTSKMRERIVIGGIMFTISLFPLLLLFSKLCHGVV